MYSAMVGPLNAEENYPFMILILKVDCEVKGWEKILSNALHSLGVRNFKMDEDGKIEVSGRVDPQMFLQMKQKSGKKLRIVSWRYGECHSNLYLPESKPEKKPEKKQETYVNGHYGYGGGYYGYGGGPGGYGFLPQPSHYNGGYGFLPQPIYPFQEALEAPPDATHRSVPDDEPKSGQADLKALETEDEPKSGVALKQCCSIM